MKKAIRISLIAAVFLTFLRVIFSPLLERLVFFLRDKTDEFSPWFILWYVAMIMWFVNFVLTFFTARQYGRCDVGDIRPAVRYWMKTVLWFTLALMISSGLSIW